jgi:subtilisin-like proprotein convertase family protein
MKTNIYLTLSAGLLLTAAAAQATILYSGPSFTGTIPDANPAGVSSSITVSGATLDTVRDVNVTLSLSGGYNGDLYGYLVGPDGGMAILLNRIGRTGSAPFGSSGSGMNITFNDSALTDIHAAGSGYLTGSYQSDGRNVNPLNVLDTDTRTHGLDQVFAEVNNRAINGTWTLFLADLSGGNTMSLVGWGLDITQVPEPTTWALAGLGGLFGLTLLGRSLRRRTA